MTSAPTNPRRRIYHALGGLAVIWLLATTVQYLQVRHALHTVDSALDADLGSADVPYSLLVAEHEERCRQLGVRTGSIKLRKNGSSLQAEVEVSKELTLGGVYHREFRATLLYRKILF